VGNWGAGSVGRVSMGGSAVVAAMRAVEMEERNATSNRKGKSIQKTSPLVYRAVEVLMDHFEPLEIKELLNLKRRTCYHLIQRIKQEQYERRIAEKERQRREREKCESCREEMQAEVEQDRVERDDGSLSVSTLREGWERPSRDIRRFRS
jgi:hypothetical protein